MLTLSTTITRSAGCVWAASASRHFSRKSASLRHGMTTVTRSERDTASPYPRVSTALSTLGTWTGEPRRRRPGRCASCPPTKRRGTICRRSSPAPRVDVSARDSASVTTTGGTCPRPSGPRSCGRRRSAAIPAPPRPSAIVAYVDDEPAGWCAVDSRGVYGRLRGSPVPWKGRDEDKDDDSVWAIACLVVAKGHRHRGLTYPLVAAAVEHARARGADAIEGYPMVTGGCTGDLG